MNLSNYLQMPPSPAVPQNPQTGSTQGAAAVLGLDTNGSVKMDFAQIMARQFQQMPQLKRQELAASISLPKLSTPKSDRDNRRNNSDDASLSSQAQDTPVDSNTASSSGSNTADAQAYLRDASARSSDTSSDSNSSSNQSRHAHQTQRSAVASADATAMPAWFNAVGPSVSVSGTASLSEAATLQASTLAATNLPDGTPLQTVALSAQTQLITDPRHAPSPQSLMAFAQSMGMAPEAISQLMGNADLSQLAVNAGSGATDVAATDPAQLAANLSQTLSPGQGAQQLQASLHAAMQANGMGGQSQDAAAMLTSMTATQVQAQSVGTPSQAVSQPANAAVSTLQMLTAADPNATLNGTFNGALNGAMQVSVLPVAPAMAASASAGTTVDVLDLRSADLPESQITALAGLLAESGQADGSSLSQDQQSNSNNPQGGFAQALATKTDPTAAGNRSNGANGISRPMSEVYDQLSEKLSTEMAARMNEQISAGQWKMKFGLRPAHLGGVEVQLEMKDGKLNAQINADNPMTRELLQNSSQRLREALANLGVQTNQVSVGQNQSGSTQTGSQGQNGGNQSQVGDNLTSSASPNEGTTEINRTTSTKGSDSLLDLYA